MDVKQGRGVVEKYRNLLVKIEKLEIGNSETPSLPRALAHANGMLDRMEEFLDETQYGGSPTPKNSSWDKFNRWLGFVQAILWVNGYFTLDQLKNHNRSHI